MFLNKIGLTKTVPSFNGEAKVASKARQRKMIILKFIFRIFRETEPEDKIEFLLLDLSFANRMLYQYLPVFTSVLAFTVENSRSKNI